MKVKWHYIIFPLIALVIVFGLSYWIYDYPMQKAEAKQAINLYMKKQGITKSMIKSKRMFRSFKMGDYGFHVTLKNDSKIGYEYIFDRGYSYYKHVFLGCYKNNYSLGIDTGMKYPPLKHQSDNSY